MRVLLLSLLAVAAADKLTCAIDGAGAINDAIDAGVYLWASTERCAQGAQYSGLKCEIDVTAALKSVINMVDIITGAVQSCAGTIDSIDAQCGHAASQMASAAAGLTSGAGSLTHWIQHKSGGGEAVADKTTTRVGKCVIDVKSIAMDIFHAAAKVKFATAGCKNDKGEACAADALAVVSVLSDIGSAIAHSIDDCPATGNSTAAMSGDIMGLVSVINNVAQAGIAIDEKCKVEESRLFSIQSNNVADRTSSTNSLILLAMVPLAAVVGFIGGRRRKASNLAQTQEIE